MLSIAVTNHKNCLIIFHIKKNRSDVLGSIRCYPLPISFKHKLTHRYKSVSQQNIFIIEHYCLNDKYKQFEF